MKRLILVAAILFSLNVYSQNSPDAIIGKWLKTPKEDLIVEVFKSGNEYNGKIAWAKDSTNKQRTGFIILENLKYNPVNKTWKNGKIHDPKSGNTYSAEARIKPDGSLELHAYKGIKLLGKKVFQENFLVIKSLL